MSSEEHLARKILVLRDRWKAMHDTRISLALQEHELMHELVKLEMEVESYEATDSKG